MGEQVMRSLGFEDDEQRHSLNEFESAEEERKIVEEDVVKKMSSSSAKKKPRWADLYSADDEEEDVVEPEEEKVQDEEEHLPLSRTKTMMAGTKLVEEDKRSEEDFEPSEQSQGQQAPAMTAARTSSCPRWADLCDDESPQKQQDTIIINDTLAGGRLTTSSELEEQMEPRENNASKDQDDDDDVDDTTPEGKTQQHSLQRQYYRRELVAENDENQEEFQKENNDQQVPGTTLDHDPPKEEEQVFLDLLTGLDPLPALEQDDHHDDHLRVHDHLHNVLSLLPRGGGAGHRGQRCSSSSAGTTVGWSMNRSFFLQPGRCARQGGEDHVGENCSSSSSGVLSCSERTHIVRRRVMRRTSAILMVGIAAVTTNIATSSV